MMKTAISTILALLIVSMIIGPGGVNAQEESGAASDAPPGILANEPQTAEECFDAALIMLRVSRPDFASHYLQKMLELAPDDDTLLRIRERYGTAKFLELSQNDDLQPVAMQLLDRVREAAANQLQNPAFFDSLLAKLQGTPRERDAATKDLKHFGPDAVPEILVRLTTGGMDRGALLHTLVQFGAVAIDPLLGAIDAPDPQIRVVAIDALGWLGDETIIPRLWYPATGVDQPPTVQQAALRAIARIRFGREQLTSRLDPVGAAEEVFQGALRHFRNEYPWVPDPEGQITLWMWDGSENRLVKSMTSPVAGSMMMAERLARQAMLMAPEREHYRGLFLAAALAHSRYAGGWDRALPVGPGTALNLALFSGAELTEIALSLAIENRNTAAAEAAAMVLGSVGTDDLLRPGGLHPRALVASLDFPNERVQFAAAVAILELDPKESFAGASRVVEILSRALRGEATGPRSVIVDPNTIRGVETASVLNRLGFTTTVAKTGQEGFREAASSGGTALAVLHPNTIRWELSQTIANLRADSRTAGVPIVIAAGEPCRAELSHILDRVPATTFVSTDGDVKLWHAQLQPLLAQVAAPPLTPEQQGAQMAAAAYWLRRIAEGLAAGTFDLVPAESALAEAVARPEVGLDAIVALGAIGRSSVQTRLLDLIVSPAIDARLREAAARELAVHIRRYGRLLREDAIVALTDAWSNASEPGVRTALSAVLGTLHPTPEAIFEKLEGYSLPAVTQP